MTNMWDQHDGDLAFKELPYYKNIVKSFFKKQIQYLLEEMCREAGEESVIMTVNLQNGTMSHLGSEVGKAFLDDRGDLKTQFLSYCISNYSLGSAGFQDDKKGKNSRQYKRKETESPSSKDESPKTPKRKKIKPSTSPVTSEHAKSGNSYSGDQDNIVNRLEVEASAEKAGNGLVVSPVEPEAGSVRDVSENRFENEGEFDNHTKDEGNDSKRTGILRNRRTKSGEQSINYGADQASSVNDTGSGQSVVPDDTSVSQEYPERCKEKKVITEEFSGNTIKIEPLSDNEDTDVEQSPAPGTKYLSTEGVVSVSRIGTVLRRRKQLASSKSRTVLTFAEKFQILQDMEANPELSFRQLAKMHNVGRTTIGQIAKNRAFYKTQYGIYAESTRKKCATVTKYNRINDLVWRWYSDAKDNGLLMSGSMVREKALEIAKELSENDFKASNGWLSSWQSRYNVKSFKVTGESRKKAIAITDWSDQVGLASESPVKETEDKMNDETEQEVMNDENDDDGDSVWTHLIS